MGEFKLQEYLSLEREQRCLAPLMWLFTKQG